MQLGSSVGGAVQRGVMSTLPLLSVGTAAEGGEPLCACAAAAATLDRCVRRMLRGEVTVLEMRCAPLELPGAAQLLP